MSWTDALVSPHGLCLGNFDPFLILLTDASSLSIFAAYCLGVPFSAFRLASAGRRLYEILMRPEAHTLEEMRAAFREKREMVEAVQRNFKTVFVLAVLFVYSCGISHLLEVAVVHRATYTLYAVVAAERALTAIISWAFVLAVFNATRRPVR